MKTVQLSFMIEYVLRSFETEILPWFLTPNQVLDKQLTVILIVTTPFTKP